MITVFTYLMKSGNLYKIGQSKNPEKRLKQLQTANHDIRIISYGVGTTEVSLHNKFKSQKVVREWFKLSRKDVEYIIRLLKNEFELSKDSKNYNRKLNITINFGKYKGLKLCDMTNRDHINYLKWFIKNSNNKKLNKLFKWWLNQIN